MVVKQVQNAFPLAPSPSATVLPYESEPEPLNDEHLCRRAQERAEVQEAEDELYAEAEREWDEFTWFLLMEDAAERGMLNARPDSPDNPLTPPC
jgi:hypothetical protein